MSENPLLGKIADKDAVALGILVNTAGKYGRLKLAQDLLEMGRTPVDGFPVSEKMPNFLPWNPLAEIKKPEDLDDALKVFADHVVHQVLNLEKWRGFGPAIGLLVQLKSFDKETWEVIADILEKQPNGSRGLIIAEMVKNHKRRQRENWENQLAFSQPD